MTVAGPGGSGGQFAPAHREDRADLQPLVRLQRVIQNAPDEVLPLGGPQLRKCTGDSKSAAQFRALDALDFNAGFNAGAPRRRLANAARLFKDELPKTVQGRTRPRAAHQEEVESREQIRGAEVSPGGPPMRPFSTPDASIPCPPY